MLVLPLFAVVLGWLASRIARRSRAVGTTMCSVVMLRLALGSVAPRPHDRALAESRSFLRDSLQELDSDDVPNAGGARARQWSDLDEQALGRPGPYGTSSSTAPVLRKELVAFEASYADMTRERDVFELCAIEGGAAGDLDVLVTRIVATGEEPDELLREHLIKQLRLRRSVAAPPPPRCEGGVAAERRSRTTRRSQAQRQPAAAGYVAYSRSRARRRQSARAKGPSSASRAGRASAAGSPPAAISSCPGLRRSVRRARRPRSRDPPHPQARNTELK